MNTIYIYYFVTSSQNLYCFILYQNIATRYNRDTYTQTKSYDPCREGPCLQADTNVSL